MPAPTDWRMRAVIWINLAAFVMINLATLTTLHSNNFKETVTDTIEHAAGISN